MNIYENTNWNHPVRPPGPLRTAPQSGMSSEDGAELGAALLLILRRLGMRRGATGHGVSEPRRRGRGNPSIENA